MSGIDKIISAITPPVTDEQRAEARAKARAEASPGDWLSQILDHHERLERAFAEARAAAGAGGRAEALKRLATLLTGHAIAEEAVVYPALAQAGHKIHANAAYGEQVAAKMQAAALERMDPESADFEDKLGHLEGAVLTHMYQEESNWLLDLRRDGSEADQAFLTTRYAEEFGRYMTGGEATPAGQKAFAEPRSFGSEASL